MPFVPAPVVQSISAYLVPKAPAPTDLALDGNEGARPDASLYEALTDIEALRRYPNAKPSGGQARRPARPEPGAGRRVLRGRRGLGPLLPRGALPGA
jgi:hypothetical protein